jgi:glycerol uptake facilitator protein
MAVFIAVYAVNKHSGAHLNPAYTIAHAILNNNFDKLIYIPAQFIGAIIGAVLAYLIYKQHYDATDDADLKLATFCNAPAINSVFYNFLTEAIITFVFILAVFFTSNNEQNVKLGALEALPVALLVLAVGLSFGGPTGYAINPARDLGPRIAHFILPIKNKRDSNWSYAWIPVVAPIVGAILAALFKKYCL